MNQQRHTNISSRIISLLIITLGIILLSYPVASQVYSAHTFATVARNYEHNAEKLNKATQHDLELKAADYNQRIRTGTTPLSDLSSLDYAQDSDYMSQLNVNDIMGQIRIPSISVTLPIYHGTGDSVLSQGAGHLYGTSLPIPTGGTNAVLAGHRGLPDALIFTRLDELQISDQFEIDILGQRYLYQVDAIWTVKPDDVSHFEVPTSINQDYVTLLTCTPYGINTQRLVIRGKHIPLSSSKPMPDHGIYPWGYIVGIILVTCVLIILVIVNLRRSRVKNTSR